MQSILEIARENVMNNLEEQIIRDSMIVEEFHKLYYGDPQKTWQNTLYKGIPTQKCPLDLWIYQEIIFETKPEIIIETGTFCGGSAIYLADLLCLLYPERNTVEDCRVYTIDINVQRKLDYPNVIQIHSNSVDDIVHLILKEEIESDKRVMVILDSDHSCAHVRAELEMYRYFVSKGQYLIVEDGNVNGNPVLPEYGAGPYEAIKDFLKTNNDFKIDKSREKFMMTFNPDGYLRRIG